MLPADTWIPVANVHESLVESIDERYSEGDVHVPHRYELDEYIRDLDEVAVVPSVLQSFYRQCGITTPLSTSSARRSSG